MSFAFINILEGPSSCVMFLRLMTYEGLMNTMYIRQCWDWDGPVSADDEHLVQVPDTLCPVDVNMMMLLRQLIDPTVDDGNYGILSYNHCVTEVTNQLTDAKLSSQVISTCKYFSCLLSCKTLKPSNMS